MFLIFLSVNFILYVILRTVLLTLKSILVTMSRGQSQNHVIHFVIMISNSGSQYQDKKAGMYLGIVPDHYDTDKETEN